MPTWMIWSWLCLESQTLTQTLLSLNMGIFVYIAMKRLLPTWCNLKDTEGPQITSVKSQSWHPESHDRSAPLDVGRLSRKICSGVIPGRGNMCTHSCVFSQVYQQQLDVDSQGQMGQVHKGTMLFFLSLSLFRLHSLCWKHCFSWLFVLFLSKRRLV